MPSVSDIARALEAWAPPGSKLSFDRVGLQVGEPGREAGRVLVALDLTPAVVAEAEAWGAGLVITHHPLLFRPLERLVPTDLVAAMAYRLARAGIAAYALHTNLDAAPGGVSFALGELLGLEELRFLEPMAEAVAKLVTFVPEAHLEAVREALAEAGAGRIGGYDACAFTSAGTGFFRPGAGTSPFSGTPGELARAPEVRLEVEVARWDLARVERALRAAHPYEEVAFDVYPVEQPSTQAGLGALGRLPEPEPLSAFLARVADRLGAEALRYSGHPEAEVARVAVCGGSGSSLLGRALAAGADAFVTADITYHTFFAPMDAEGRPRLALIDAGHYETEWVAERLIVEALGARFPGLEVRRSEHRTSPMRTHVRGA